MYEHPIGIDVSLYDTVVDWRAFQEAQWTFAFIKIGEGSYEDPMFKDQWQAAKGYTWRGPYHFYRPLVSWRTAAEKTVSLLNREGMGELPAVLDLEATNGVPNAQICETALEWLRYVHRETGMRPIVYTSPGFSNTIAMFRYVDFADYPLWEATYPWDRITATWTEAQRRARLHEITMGIYDYKFPVACRPWEDVGRPVTFAQFTGMCPPEYVPGYPLGDKKAVDVNFCKLSLPEMVSLFDLPKLEGGIVSTKPTTWTGELQPGMQCNLRTGAGLTYGAKKLYTAPLSRPLKFKGTGLKLHNPKDGYYWGEVISIDDQAVTGFVAFTTSFGATIDWLDSGEVPTQPPDKPLEEIVITQTFSSPGLISQTVTTTLKPKPE